jgi:hypothetical protein
MRNEARQALFATFTQLDRRVREVAHDDAVCRRFIRVPGVGEITALSFKAAVDAPAPFAGPPLQAGPRHPSRRARCGMCRPSRDAASFRLDIRAAVPRREPAQNASVAGGRQGLAGATSTPLARGGNPSQHRRLEAFMRDLASPCASQGRLSSG